MKFVLLDRIKREVSSSMVEKGVNERVRLAQIYEKKTEELEKQHEEIRHNFNDLKNKVSDMCFIEILILSVDSN